MPPSANAAPVATRFVATATDINNDGGSTTTKVKAADTRELKRELSTTTAVTCAVCAAVGTAVSKTETNLTPLDTCAAPVNGNVVIRTVVKVVVTSPSTVTGVDVVTEYVVTSAAVANANNPPPSANS